MKRLLLFLLCSLLTAQSSLTFAAAPDPKNYAYEKIIEIPESLVGELVVVPIPTEDLQLIEPSFKNLQLTNRYYDEVDFELLDNRPGKKKGGLTILNISSSKEGEPEYLLDNDVLTSFLFDEKKDGSNPSTMLLDLGEIYAVNRINTYTTDGQASIRTYEIAGGKTRDDIRTVRRRRPMEQRVDFFTPREMRYIEFRWWGTQVLIDDINIYVDQKAQIYFVPQEAGTYRLLFGNPQVRSVRYARRLGNALPNATTVEAGRTQINELFPEDFDGDGIPNIEDNCLFEKNKDQVDDDEDLIGDACDNVLNQKNRYQYDTDRDGVGNEKDNCMLIYNPDQKDRDDDGFGNACDNAHAKKPLITRENKPYFLYGLLAVLVLGVGGLFMSEKWGKKQDQKK